MDSEQHAVIFSPCVFTRAGLYTVIKGLLAKHPLGRVCQVGTPGQALKVLSTSPEAVILVVHVTPLLLVDHWSAFDKALRCQGLYCPILLLCDPESFAILPSMPFLSARTRLLTDSGVTLKRVSALLLEAMGTHGAVFSPKVAQHVSEHNNQRA